jgi:hypothetical protein
MNQKISNVKLGTLPHCDACDGWVNQSAFRRQYAHPNGERYWMNICVFCLPKHAEFEVQS